jgi:hypothetical protein
MVEHVVSRKLALARPSSPVTWKNEQFVRSLSQHIRTMNKTR